MVSTANNLVIFVVTVTIFTSAAQSDLIMKMVQKQNILIEKHTVITPDGYILGLYHIPARKNTAIDDTKVMFMMHGLFSSSAQNVLYARDSAAFYFHDYGYDVWLGNARGNTFSRNHTKLDPEGGEFWQFSLDECGTIDMPAFIDHILEYTKKEKLILYGHSMGGTIPLVLLTERPEYNDKVSSVHLLGVPAVTENTQLYVKLFSSLHNSMELTDTNCAFEVLKYEDFAEASKLIGEFCAKPILNNVCEGFLEQTGTRFSNNSFTTNVILDMTSAGIPAGASYGQVMHYIQCYKTGSFGKYDYGPTKNLKLYGSDPPPIYNLSNVRTNVHLMYGTHDMYATESDALYLCENMRNAKQIRKDIVGINHFEFLVRPHVKRVQEIVNDAITWFEE